MQKPFYSIQLNKLEQTAEIHIYGVIGEGNPNDHTFAKSFVRDFQEVEGAANTINIRINSPGGSVWDGLPIFNAICASQKKVHTYVDGIAYSMGAMIALAGHTVHMANGSLLMLHNVSGLEFGNAKSLRKSAETMDKYDALFADLIATRASKTIEFVQSNWLNYEDNYFTPEEAKEAGLIDVIESYQAKNIPTNIRTLNPCQVAAFYQTPPVEPNQTFIEKVITSVKNTLAPDPMNKFKKLVTIGIKAEDEESVEVEKAGTEMENIKQENDALKSEIEALKQEKEELKTEIDELKKQLNDVSAPSSSPIAPADVIYNSSSRNNFETSFDREARAAFGR